MTEKDNSENVVTMHDGGAGSGGDAPGGGMDETRERVRRQVEELRQQDRRHSDTFCARNMGLSPSVFSQWMKGTYKGDNAACEHKALQWLRSLEERRLSEHQLPEAPGFVDTPTSRRVNSALLYAHQAADLVVIHGEAGVGKTETCRQYQQAHPNVWIATMTPATSRAGSALEDIADELDLAGNVSRPRQVQREVVKFLRHREGLLIVDEAQQLGVPGLEMVRSLYDLTGIGLAIVGNPSVYSRMTGGSRGASYAQIFGRIGKSTRLAGSTYDDAAAIGRAWGVTGKAQYNVLHQIARKPGGVRVASKTLRMATLIARQREVAVDGDTIREAYRELTGGQGQ